MGNIRLKAFGLVLILLSAYIWYSCVPIAQQTTNPAAGGASSPAGSAALRYEDYVYDPSVKTVQCYVRSGHPEEVLNPPVVPLEQTQPIVLEFDQLNTPQQRFLVKLIYCNADWSEARITQAQFMPSFNEFYITDVTPSFNTKVKYFHYRFVVPAVKLSGNYLLSVTDQQNRNIITRRLMVYEQRVVIAARPVLPAGAQERQSYQQIDFDIRYNQYALVNPSQEVNVTLRQNNRWNNAKINLKPLFVRDTERKLEFTYFNLENSFPGLNEYRYFDTRSMRSLGANVANANRQATPEEIRLLPDKSRAREAFSSQVDINGKYIIGNREYGNGFINGDYNWVTFNLASPQPAPGNVYIYGELADWQLQKEFQLQYDAANQQYTGQILLKQGYYNYNYAVQTGNLPNEIYYEGSFNLTENQYDIIVYYRPPGARTDLIIGYQPVSYNGRR